MKKFIIPTILLLSLLLIPITTYTSNARASDNTSYEFESFSLNVTVPQPVVGGGGGGGWAPPLYTISTDFFGVEKTYYLEDGIEITSPDGNLTVTIPENTIALGEDGKSLERLSVVTNGNPPEPPEGAYIIGLPYTFGPGGATFDPPMTLTWSYDPDAVPEGVVESSLVVAYYDEDAGEWVELECVVDTENNTITATVYHFTVFALIATQPPTPEEPTVPVPPGSAPPPTSEPPVMEPPVVPPTTPLPVPLPEPEPAPVPVEPLVEITEEATPWGLIMGYILGGLVVIILIALAVRRWGKIWKKQ